MKIAAQVFIILALAMLGASVQGFLPGAQISFDLSKRGESSNEHLVPRMARPRFSRGSRWDALWDSFNRGLWSPHAIDAPTWMQEAPSMAVDVKDGEKEYVVSVDVPGVSRADVHVETRDGMLQITAERKHEAEDRDDKHSYHRVERSYGRFFRSLALPEAVDEDRVKAEMDNGVLTVTFQKKQNAKPSAREIAVN